MTDTTDDPRKKERSPSFPFISLKKAVERARTIRERFGKESPRVITAGSAWGFQSKSSGLQQTVAALKQYGLLDDSGAKEDRRISLTPLALRILVDTRPGQREDALLESALKPRLFTEYRSWAKHRPPDDHCLSELKLDRGFTDEAAKTFMRVFLSLIHI